MSKCMDIAENRLEWLSERKKGIGASEASAVLGLSPWLSNTELWELKTGRREPKDLSGNTAVDIGNRTEDAMRVMFLAEHPEYTLEYNQHGIIYQDGARWLSATLDGELICEDGKRGILEIKTSTPQGKAAWDKWRDKIPQNYYIQILWQFLATGYDFAYLYAKLIRTNGDSELRSYRFDRADCEEDMKYVYEKGKEFWEYNVLQDVRPSTILPSL